MIRFIPHLLCDLRVLRAISFQPIELGGFSSATKWGFGVGRCCCPLSRSNCCPALRHARSAPPLPLCPALRSSRPAPPRPSSPGILAPAPPSLPSQLLPCLVRVGQWGRGTGQRNAEAGWARRGLAPGWVSFQTSWQRWTSRHCECGSRPPARSWGPVKRVCFLLAWALNGEELSLNGNLPLPWLEAGSPALQEGSLPSQPPGKSNFSIYRSSLKHLVCKES